MWKQRCKKYLICLVVFLMLWPHALRADEKDHEDLRNIKTVYEKAVNGKKLDLLKGHLSKEFSGVMLTGEEVKGFEGLNTYWKKIEKLIGEGGVYEVVINPEPSTIMGDVAMAHGTATEKVVANGGELYEFTSHWTAVLKKEGATWKVLRVHGSMDPIKNPFVKSIVSKATFWTALITAVIALLIGFVTVSYTHLTLPTIYSV